MNAKYYSRSNLGAPEAANDNHRQDHEHSLTGKLTFGKPYRHTATRFESDEEAMYRLVENGVHDND